MKREFAAKLVCPDCLSSLDLEISQVEKGEVKNGWLHCSQCTQVYPITHFVPRFVDNDGYTENFSFEWNKHPQTQFDNEILKESQTAFFNLTGLSPNELNDLVVLDMGCGTGRFIDVAAKFGTEVIGVDMSYAIDVAQSNLGHLSNVHLVQADIFHLPFKPSTFSMIYSLGVLHHTPDCEKAFKKLSELLSKGGKIAVWVYPRYGFAERIALGAYQRYGDSIQLADTTFAIPVTLWPLFKSLARLLDDAGTVTTDILRLLTTRIPKKMLYYLCYVAVPLYHAYRIPFFYPLRVTLRISMHHEWRWRVLDTFDWYSPKFQSKHTYDEVVGWYRDVDLTEIKKLNRPVSVVGQRF